MSFALVVALTAAATWVGLCFLGLDAVAYRSLRRAAARGDIDDTPAEVVHPMRLNAMGQNPDITYRYTTFELPVGKAAILRGRVHPDADYTSLVVYDSLLQSVLPHRTEGPTLVTERDLELDAEGGFVLVLAHADPGQDTAWLDVSATPRGVYFERHIGAAPEVHTRLEVVDHAVLSQRLADR